MIFDNYRGDILAREAMGATPLQAVGPVTVVAKDIARPLGELI
jgi:hypothetical protein